MRKTAITLAALALATPAAAQCVWTWDCTTGQCRQVPICQNTIDLPPLHPIELPPLAPPSIRPLNPPTVPPPGAKQCQQRYICKDGQCVWRQVCQ